MVMGCAKSLEIKTEKDIGSMNTIDSYRVVSPEKEKEPPFILVFGNSGSSIDANVLFFIKKDGTFIWSNNRMEGGAPYYRGQLTMQEMEKLRKELLFLRTIHSQFRFIPSYRHPPDYSFGFMTIFDDELLMSVLLVGRDATLGFYLPPDEMKDDKVLNLLKEDDVLSPEISTGYYKLLWDYMIRIFEKYIPLESQKAGGLSFEVRPIEYLCPAQTTM
jgi:hypothetical protein